MVEPENWGPHYWYVFHTYAAIYPDNPTYLHRDIAKTFIKSIPFLLPCADCSKHAFHYIAAKVKNLDTIVSSKQKLIVFFKDFHNSVNIRLNKPIYR